MSDKNPMLDGGENMLATVTAAGSELTTWSENKKKDFVALFRQRARVSQYLLNMTATFIARGAISKKFISDTRANDALGRRLDRYGCRRITPFNPENVDKYRDEGLVDSYNSARMDHIVGGRPRSELDQIAQERADVVLADLPPLRQVVNILDADLAEKIDRLEEIKKNCKKLYNEFVELGEPINMSTVDQDMTIAEFRKLVKTTVSTRQTMLDKLNELSKEGNELDEFISVRLYKGLPGLTEAVEEVIKLHLARATMFEQTTRRIEERVMFGDSAAAVEIMSSFEKDELAVDENIKKTFADALEKLNVSKMVVKKGKNPNAKRK